MTRIIGGDAGGRRLRTPTGDATRPTSDRVREALFSSVEAALGTLSGRAVLDLYSSPDRREGIRRHNLATVETYFIDRCARRYESIFEQAITAHADALEPARQK